jgi:hypothetical protein
MWIFLALPAVWLAWSLIFFCAGLLSFIWTSGDKRIPALTPFNDEAMGFLPMSSKQFIPLWPRIILTVIFAIGLGLSFLVWQVFSDADVTRLVATTEEFGDSDSEAEK